MNRAVGAHGLFVPMTWGDAPGWYRTRRWRLRTIYRAMNLGRWPRLASCGPLALPDADESALNGSNAPAQRQRRVLKPAWGNAPGNAMQNKERAESPCHPTVMRYLSSHHERCRWDKARRWRSCFVGSGHMGRCPMLASTAPLALGENWLVTILGRCPRLVLTGPLAHKYSPCHNH